MYSSNSGRRDILKPYDTRGICVLNDVGVGSNERLRSKDKGKVGGWLSN